MKHITRQGPVYVRSKNKLLLNDDNIDENYFEGKCSSEHSSLKFVVDNDIKQPPSSSKMVSSFNQSLRYALFSLKDIQHQILNVMQWQVQLSLIRI